jgi:ankyrin repeat protein
LHDDEGNTALLYAVMHDDLEAAQLLFEQGFGIFHENNAGLTSLHAAVEKGNVDMIAFLLEALLSTGDIEDYFHAFESGAVFVDDKLPQVVQESIMIAASSSHDNAGVMLHAVEQGMDVNVRTSHGFTPLLFACSVGDADVARELLGHGADVNAVENDGW